MKRILPILLSFSCFLVVVHKTNANVKTNEKKILNCASPVALSVVNITLTGATLQWTDQASATQWEVAIIPQGEQLPDVGTVTTSVQYTVTGLTPGQCYQFYVRTLCSATMYSEWSGPYSFCSIPPQGVNHLTGTVRADINGDGICNSNDLVLSNVELQVAINGVNAGSVFTNLEGSYDVYLAAQEAVTVTLSPVALSGLLTPASVTATYTFTSSQTQTGPDFCFSPTSETVNNLGLVISTPDSIVPGFDFYVVVTALNMGNTVPGNTTALFTYDPARFTLVSYDGAASTASGSVYVVFSNVSFWGSQAHVLMFHAAEPPVNVSGDMASFTAVLDYNDDNVADNTAVLYKQIVNSFDPNDITVHQGLQIARTQIGEYLTYTVRFQNTGTFAATNVRIEQQLDANLDWSTFTPLTQSHVAQVTRDGSALVYKFNNINLTYSEDDEAASHGYITYKIKPKNTVAVGDYVYGTANIYFDFNEAIVTNTCSTQIVEATSGVHDFDGNSITLYPNPVKDVLNVNLTQGKLLSVSIYDINGRLCLQSGTATTVKTDGLAPGMYLVKVVADKGIGNYKLIKK